MWNGKKQHHQAQTLALGTLISGMAPGERHNAGRNKRTRGRAARDRQLGPVQRRILKWLIGQESTIQQRGSPAEKEALERLGIPWSGAFHLLGVSASAASTALRGASGRSLLNRRLVKVRLGNGRWITTQSLEKADRVTGVRLTPTGITMAELVDPTTLEDVRQEVRANVTALYEERHGPEETWTKATRMKFEDQIQEATDIRARVVGSLGFAKAHVDRGS